MKLGWTRPVTGWMCSSIARQASVDRAWIESLRASGRPCGKAGAEMMDFYLRSFEKPSAALYDPLAVLWLILFWMYRQKVFVRI